MKQRISYLSSSRFEEAAFPPCCDLKICSFLHRRASVMAFEVTTVLMRPRSFLCSALKSSHSLMRLSCLAVHTDKATWSHISGVISEQMGAR